MERDNFELEGMLARRALPRPPADLAERIIFAAVSTIQGKPSLSLWQELTGMIALPHPSVMAAACILFGLLVGVQASEGLSSLQQDWSSFLYVNEGGWL